MPRGAPITDEVATAIKAELEKMPHASLIARESKGAWSYATVWRIADRAGIELTEGRKTMGRPLSPELRAKVEQAVEAHPEATQLGTGAANRGQPLDRRPSGSRAPRGLGDRRITRMGKSRRSRWRGRNWHPCHGA
jgi:hypothetical protein